MKFLVDAQLPRALARWLQHRGHDAVHTLDLPDQNQTKDSVLLKRASDEARILITKDADFQITFQLGKGPPKLMLVTTGNITNSELIDLFEKNLATILQLLEKNHFVELNRGALIVHR